MHPFARYRIGVVSLFAVCLLVVAAAACTDDDDRDPGAPAGTGDGTPAGEFGVPTPGPDDQANEVMRMTVDLTWMDDDDNEHAADIQYQITNVGETEGIEIPGM